MWDDKAGLHTLDAEKAGAGMIPRLKLVGRIVKECDRPITRQVSSSLPWALSNYNQGFIMLNRITEEESVFLKQHIDSAMGPKTGMYTHPPTEEMCTLAAMARIGREFFLFRLRNSSLP